MLVQALLSVESCSANMREHALTSSWIVPVVQLPCTLRMRTSIMGQPTALHRVKELRD